MWVCSRVWYKLVKLALRADFFNSLPLCLLAVQVLIKYLKEKLVFYPPSCSESRCQDIFQGKGQNKKVLKTILAPAGRWLSVNEYSLIHTTFEVTAGVYPSSASLQWNMAVSPHSPHGTVESFTHANELQWQPILFYQGKHKLLIQIISAPEECWTSSLTS